MRMADEPVNPETPQASPEDSASGADKGTRRKRATPTIDLKATELDDTPKPDAANSKPAATAKPGPLSSPAVRLGVAAGSGAIVVVVVLAVLWSKGVLPVGAAGSSAADAKIAALEKQVSELQSRSQTPANDDALAQRVSKIEDTIAKLPSADPTILDKLAATDKAMKSLGLALTALNQRTDAAASNAADARKAADAAVKAVSDLQTSIASSAASGVAGVPRADLDALKQRVAALETQAKAAHDAIASNTGNDSAARLALSAAVLRDAVAVGAPYGDELAAVRDLGGDDKALAPLNVFAASGVPSAQALARELRGMLPALIKAWHAQAPNAGFFERLQANASNLIRITPVDAPAGDDPSAVLARVEIDAAKADIAAALADLGKLPDRNLTEQLRAPLQQWIAKAKARQAAIDAARQYASATARALRPQ
jgi:hypothetical protein